MPMERAVPRTVFTAASSVVQLRSGIFCFAMSSTCFAVTVPTLLRFGSADPFARFATFLSSTEAGGHLGMEEYVRSQEMVTTTGFIYPSSFSAFALTSLHET